MNKSVVLLTLFLCLNGRLFATEKPMIFGLSNNTMSIEKVIDLNADCPTNFLFDSGFEDSEEIMNLMVKESLK